VKSIPSPLIAALLASFAAGCSADDDPTERSGAETDPMSSPDAGTPDPFADCDRTVLEPDAAMMDEHGNPVPPRWIGPAADPQTGALALDPNTSYHVSATYLPLLPSEAAMAEFSGLQPALAETLAGHGGVLALQLLFSPSCNVARTFTVWRDEDAMVEFVVSPAHLQAMAALARMSRGGSTTVSWTASPGDAISTEEGLRRLGGEPVFD